MAMLGDLSDFSLPDILQMFERAGKTGQLSVWSPTGIFRLWFYQGRIIAAIPPDHQYRLRELIASKESIAPELSAILKKASSFEEPIGNYLRKKELLAPAELTQIFRKQMKVGLYPLFQLKSGQFRFADNIPLPYDEMTGLSKSGMDAAMEGLRQQESSTQVQENLPQADSTFIQLVTELPLLKLSTLEWGIWEQVHLQKNVREISQHLQTDLLEVRQACLRLMQIGLIEEVIGSQKQPPQAVKEKKELPINSKSSATSNSSISGPSETATAINPNLLNRLSSLLKGIR